MPQGGQTNSGLRGEGLLSEVLLKAKGPYVFADSKREFFRAGYCIHTVSITDKHCFVNSFKKNN